VADRFSIIGAGLVGRAWAFVFARAGGEVVLHDANPRALEQALELIDANLADLEEQGLIREREKIRANISAEPRFEAAVAEAAWVQENIFEDVDAKREIFAELDRAAPSGAIIASSSSTIPASAFTEDLPGRGRCLIAHPVNPPSLIPVVELSPAPWTDESTVESAQRLMSLVGMEPILVRKEIDGFIVNRLQIALLNEAFKLVADGYVSVEDLDKTIKHGLGLRWSFMGPLETIDLNAPKGIRDYIERFGPAYQAIARQQSEFREWDEEMLTMLEDGRREFLPQNLLKQRAGWRDRRLMALLRHRSEASRRLGD
jgi:L-gulonate 3-dehydrogenase